jgi:hypothetical protein
MRRIAFLLPLGVAACAATPEAGEHLGRTDQRFTSREAVLLDFEFDGRLLASAASLSDPRPLIEAQLMFTVGQLNGDRAVGRYERLELSNIEIHTEAADESEVTYHARLPVAWGQSPTPTTYVVKVPARVAEEDQIRFADLYGASCVDPSAGEVDAWRMFLFFRPQRTGCALDPNDLVTSTATVKASADNTTGKYPEYHRIWEDGALDVVAMFGRAEEAPSADDEGVRAYETFVQKARAYLGSLQPNDAERTMRGGTTTDVPVKLGATLPDGRSVTIDVMLVDYRLGEGATRFDAWYDPLTPGADLILYNGHAGLGENVRTLMKKGSFRPRQYAIWAVNGCDTFAYVDRSLADRRALLNPDDPLGTKYMDTVSNVMSAYFNTLPDVSMTLVEAIVAAGAARAATEPRTAKTYQEIFASIDPEQVVAVTGEEDNEFQPRTDDPAPVVPNTSPLLPPPSAQPELGGELGGEAGCDAGGRGGNGTSALSALLGLLSALAARRRLRTAD